jgi:GDP-4-dehydro-6-deoxy-D-mannose reductase
VRILITGVGGFVGGHLSQYILRHTPQAELHGTIIAPHEAAHLSGFTCHLVELRDSQATLELIDQIQPDHIYHLAAQAFVPRSFENPWETLENNILAQLNVIQACLNLDLRPRMVIVSSAEIYGVVQPHELPLTEESPFRPTSPYSVSKVTQDMLGLQYYLSHRMPIMRARAFNHLGPGQNQRFVAPDFAMQISRIEAGQQPPEIYVGDLSAQRDFTDVRDVVRAYCLIMERGVPGEVYNVASGKAYSIQMLLETLLKHSSANIRVVVDSARIRPTEIPVLRGDATRLYKATGWQPQISFEQTLLDVLNDCRERVQQERKVS